MLGSYLLSPHTWLLSRNGRSGRLACITIVSSSLSVQFLLTRAEGKDILSGSATEGGGHSKLTLPIGSQSSSKLVDVEEVRNLLHTCLSWLDMPNLSGQGRNEA